MPGTTTDKVVAYFKKFAGVARNQKIPCDRSVQNGDKVQLLSDGRQQGLSKCSVIGLLLYVARDGVDAMYAVNQLSASMSSPTVWSFQRLANW